MAFRIPNLFRRVLGEGAFSQAFVPVLAATRAEDGDEGAKALIDHVGTLLAWTLVLLCIAGVLGAPWMVWAMASGLQPQGFDAAVTMTRWMFPYIGFMSLVALAGGILNTHGRSLRCLQPRRCCSTLRSSCPSRWARPCSSAMASSLSMRRRRV